MSEFIKYPTPLYDEPAKYYKFDGGINNDPANENLRPNELRDAINCDYKSDGNITRRLGAKQFKELRFNDTNINVHRNIIQGTFNYVGKYNMYFIAIRDGFIYYSSLGESDVLNMIEIPIIVDRTKKLYAPDNVVVDMDVYDPLAVIQEGEPWYGIANIDPVAIPSNLSNHDGYVLISEHIHPEDDGAHNLDGPNPYSGIYRPGEPKLILQNHKTVQGAAFDDKLYIATGTKFIYLEEVIDGAEIKLTATIINPYKTNGFDVTHIGYNYLSPFPEIYIADTNVLAVSRINGIICEEHTIFEDSQVSTEFKAVMDFIIGTSKTDYWFKWEWKKSTDTTWTVVNTYINGNGEQTKVIPFVGLVAGEIIQVKCSYSTLFKTYDNSGVVTPMLDLAGDWVVDTAFAEFGQAERSYTVELLDIDTYRPTPAQAFFEIHSCNKLFTDGNQMILYGSKYKEGNWYKTIIQNFAYVSLRNSLNFQTDKNERIVACLALEGNIIVFADNPHLGGSIHKVYGNGNDYDASDGYFSPFKKKIVNTSVSCDHPNSVQFVKNYIMFKYRNSVYLIDSRELNAERLNVTKISHQIAHDRPEIQMPVVEYSDDYELELFSEITEDYYSLIFPKERQRWKMYFNMGRQYENSNVVYFPWLRDIGEIFYVDNVVKINNISTTVLDDKLIQYTDDTYNDLGEKFHSVLKLKGYDMYNQSLVKFVNALHLYYYRGATDHLSLDVTVYNEANYKLIGAKFESFYDPDTHTIQYGDPNTYYSDNIDPIDRRALILGVTPLGDSILGKDLFSSKLFRPDLKFPCLNAFIEIKIDSSEAFSLSSITFDYTTTDLPEKSLPNVYNDIIRKE